MKHIFFMGVFVFVAIPFANAQTNEPLMFSSNLFLGSSGTAVFALQQILNRDPQTQIRVSGPGSPGQETSYFGTLTEAAVMKFQEKYSKEILLPSGLSSGNGYIGYYTRVKLNSLFSPLQSSSLARGKDQLENSQSASNATSSNQDLGVGQNPNLENLDVALANIDRVGKTEGYSDAKLALIKDAVIQRVSTTTNLRNLFLKRLAQNSPQSFLEKNTLGRSIAIILKNIEQFILPPHAYAQALSPTGVPFGARLLFFIPCDGGIWNLYITPLPPSYVTVLNYLSFSELYASYNLPGYSGISLLGKYIPGPGACVVGIQPVPAEGVITPQVGSSLR